MHGTCVTISGTYIGDFEKFHQRASLGVSCCSLSAYTCMESMAIFHIQAKTLLKQDDLQNGMENDCYRNIKSLHGF